jgi:GntR family transcriptional repressor for pyruvate dehydrogenase complex
MTADRLAVTQSFVLHARLRVIAMTQLTAIQANGALRPVRRRNISHTIAERLADQIRQGRRRPGERLPSERDLSEAFEVSRSSVREAIKTLESRGLVEGRQGEGTFVRRPSLEALVQVPAVPVSVTEREVLHLFEVREMLEPAVARTAAEQSSAADLAALRRMMQQQERMVENGRYSSDDDTRFHLRLVRITGNPVLIRLLEGVMHMLAVVREPALRAASTTGLRVTLAGHWDVVRAVEAHDPGLAAEKMADHLRGARATAIRSIRDLQKRIE